jgi:hypothetical protein
MALQASLVSNAKGVCSGSILGLFRVFALVAYLMLLVPELRRKFLSPDPSSATLR